MAFMRVHWSFPATYPFTSDIPTFELEKNPTVSPITRQKIISTIKEIRAANLQCLVATSGFLLGAQERIGRRLVEEESDSESEKEVMANIPMLMRTCGASFGPNGEYDVWASALAELILGQLVCFFPRQTILARTRAFSRSPSITREQRTPLAKAMSALARLENPRQRAIRTQVRSPCPDLADLSLVSVGSKVSLNPSRLAPR